MTNQQFIEWAIERSLKHESHLTEDVLKINGMSSPKVRHLLNNLCSRENTNYLEIGLFRGATFVAALYGNTINSAVGIDNFSEYFSDWGHQRPDFYINYDLYLKDREEIKFYEEDSFSIDLSKFKNKVNVYFYDGQHREEDQYNALQYYRDVLDDTFIFLVDDYDNGHVQNSTQAAIKDLGFSIEYENHLRSNSRGDLDLWWSGLYVSILSK